MCYMQSEGIKIDKHFPKNFGQYFRDGFGSDGSVVKGLNNCYQIKYLKRSWSWETSNLPNRGKSHEITQVYQQQHDLPVWVSVQFIQHRMIDVFKHQVQSPLSLEYFNQIDEVLVFQLLQKRECSITLFSVVKKEGNFKRVLNSISPTKGVHHTIQTRDLLQKYFMVSFQISL